MVYLIKKYNLITEDESIHGVALTLEKAKEVVDELNKEKSLSGRHFYRAWYEEVDLYANR